MKLFNGIMLISVVVLFNACGETGTGCRLANLERANAQCKYLEVKANPSDMGDNRKINIYYTRVPAKNSSNKKAPIVYLTGGPGSSSVIDMDKILSHDFYSSLRENHDLIAIDYRGTGFSTPFPKCKGGASSAEDINNCVKNLNKDIHVKDYTSKNIAIDIDKVLEKENIKKANLLGVSYGTRLALTIARDFPSRVKSLTLDGLFPIEVNGLSQAREAILDKLKTMEDKYSRDYPRENFATKLDAVIDKIKSVKGNDSTAAFLKALTSHAYEDNVSEKYVKPNFDKILDGTHPFIRTAGNLEIGEIREKSFSTIMFFAVILYEEYAFIHDEDQQYYNFGFSQKVTSVLSTFRGGSPVPISEIAKLRFDISPKNNIEKQAVRTNIKTLILSAEHDNQTPLYWSKQARQYLTNSKLFFFKDTEHGLSMDNPYAQVLIDKFIESENINILDNERNDHFIQIP
ncbi:MAG: alpha/beta hydrolase [Sulfurovum sp.]|nr:alpha/beta hydrolase [Sulfurovum sp.]